MAIQFRCPGCSEPIEVDDVYAGQTAACPYCRRVVNVPHESVLDDSPLVTARPTAEGAEGAKAEAPGLSEDSRSGGPGQAPPPPAPGYLHIGPTRTPRERVASRYGTYGLICTALVLFLFAAFVVYYVGVLIVETGGDLTSQPSAKEMAEIQAGAMEKLITDPRIKAIRVGTAFFAVVGLVCGIISVSQHRHNWKGIVSLVVCGLFTLCTCGDLLSILFETITDTALLAPCHPVQHTTAGASGGIWATPAESDASMYIDISPFACVPSCEPG